MQPIRETRRKIADFNSQKQSVSLLFGCNGRMNESRFIGLKGSTDKLCQYLKIRNEKKVKRVS